MGLDPIVAHDPRQAVPSVTLGAQEREKAAPIMLDNAPGTTEANNPVPAVSPAEPPKATPFQVVTDSTGDQEDIVPFMSATSASVEKGKAKVVEPEIRKGGSDSPIPELDSGSSDSPFEDDEEDEEDEDMNEKG